jgi:predicted DNA-binding transcriptional regulator YafY
MERTLERHWAMLSAIPATTWVSTTALCERLREQGYEVTPRQVQADLARYAASGSAFPLQCNAASKPYQYRWPAALRLQPIPALDAQMAVALALVEKQLEPLLPAPSRDYLKPYFQEARRRLEGTGSGAARLASWSNKVLVVPDGAPLRPPEVLPAVREAVHEALLAEQILEVTYEPRNRPSEPYLLSPLGLLYRGSVQMLVCLKLDDDRQPVGGPRTFLLHRMQRAVRVAQPRPGLADFDLAAYHATSSPAYRLGDDVWLRALVAPDAVTSLEEGGLGTDQRLTRQPDGRVLLEATVAHTYALQVWLLGFAEAIEVLEPQTLRDELARKLRAAAARYGEAG